MIEWFSLWSVAKTERKHLFNGQCGTKPSTKNTPVMRSRMTGVFLARLRLARTEFPSSEKLHLEKKYWSVKGGWW